MLAKSIAINIHTNPSHCRLLRPVQITNLASTRLVSSHLNSSGAILFHLVVAVLIGLSYLAQMK